jgi:2-oxoglutarate ferredoxin oxidoreductase subunit beta
LGGAICSGGGDAAFGGAIGTVGLVGAAGCGFCAKAGVATVSAASSNSLFIVSMSVASTVNAPKRASFHAPARQGEGDVVLATFAQPPDHLVGLALQLGATYVGRGFSGDKARLVPI